MKSFRDPATGVLKAFGFVEANAPGDLVGDESDDFDLEPGKWQRVGDAWVEYAPPLVDRQAQAWEAIKAKRDMLSDSGGYKVAALGVDKWFHSDEKSKTQQLGLFIMGASVPAVQWKTMDGSFVTMTQAIATAVFQAAASQDMAIFQAAETHKAAMEAASDPLAYDFSGGWPATFEGPTT